MDTLLSIAILTPGKKKTLEACLASLDSLRQQVPCQLVIVDTGCDATHRALIEHYADTIVDFTWCDDFAAAKNAGLRACNGAWYLTIDDDEVFFDTTEIEEFFRSGDYQNYTSATMVLRDFYDWEERRYKDLIYRSLFQKVETLQWEGCVHEQLRYPKGREKHLNTIRGHYGYIFDTVEQRNEHSQRNIRLIQKMLEEQPDHMEEVLQLCQEYRTIEAWQDLLELSTRYLPMAEKRYGEKSAAVRILQCAQMDALVGNRDWDDGETFCHAVVKSIQNQETEQLRMEGVCAFAYFELVRMDYARGKDEAVLSDGNAYLNFYDSDGNRIELYSDYVFLDDVFSSYGYQLVCQMMMMAAMRSRQMDALSCLVHRIDWTSPHMMLHADFLSTVYEVAREDSYYPALNQLIGAMKKNDEIALQVMKQLLVDYMNQKTEAMEYYMGVRNDINA